MLGHGAETNPEELLDVFKAAALSVTKLYKTSTSAQGKARLDGYQDCLEDLLAVLDKGDTDVRTIRRWIAERLDGREPIVSTVESEDEVEKTDAGSTPEPPRNSRQDNECCHGKEAVQPVSSTSLASNNDTAMQTETDTPSPSARRSAAAATTTATTATARGSETKPRIAAAKVLLSTSPASSSESEQDYAEPVEVQVPMQDAFTFRSPMPYPTDSFLELANLDLSDRRSGSGLVRDASDPSPNFSATGSATTSAATSAQAPSPAAAVFSPPSAPSPSPTTPSLSTAAKPFRVRHGATRSGSRSAAAARYNRSTAGQKRKLNFDEIFDLASLGYGKDVFGRGGGKRSRQA